MIAFLQGFAKEYRALTNDPAFAPEAGVPEGGRRLARILANLEDRIQQLEENQGRAATTAGKKEQES